MLIYFPSTGLYNELHQESKEEVHACVYVCSTDSRPADALISYLQSVTATGRAAAGKVCVCVR